MAVGMIVLVGLIGAVISAVVGTIWYNPDWTMMGKRHMKYLGLDALTEEEQKAMREAAMPHMRKTYLAQFGLSFVTAIFIVGVTMFTVANGGPASAVYYYVLFIWIAFTLPLIGQGILWGNVEGNLRRKKFFSDGLYNLLVFILIAGVAVLFFG